MAPFDTFTAIDPHMPNLVQIICVLRDIPRSPGPILRPRFWRKWGGIIRAQRLRALWGGKTALFESPEHEDY